MMAHDEFPMGGRGSETFFEPLKLNGAVLGRDVAIAGIVLIGFHEGAGVEVEKLDVGGGVDGMELRVITGGHVPAWMGLAIGDLGVAVAVVIVVAEDGVPGNLEGVGGVDVLEGFVPERVVDGGDAVLVKVVADRDDEAGGNLFAGDAHLGGDLGLIGLAPAAPVTNDGEVEGFGGRRAGVEIAGEETAGQRGLGSDEKSSDEIAAREMHGGILVKGEEDGR